MGGRNDASEKQNISSPDRNKKMLRLQCVAQQYEWGKLGADSAVAKLKVRTPGPDPFRQVEPQLLRDEVGGR